MYCKTAFVCVLAWGVACILWLVLLFQHSHACVQFVQQVNQVFDFHVVEFGQEFLFSGLGAYQDFIKQGLAAGGEAQNIGAQVLWVWGDGEQGFVMQLFDGAAHACFVQAYVFNDALGIDVGLNREHG